MATAANVNQAQQLEAALSNFRTYSDPAIFNTIQSVNTQHEKLFSPLSVIQPGTQLPAFTLPNALGKDVTSASLLANGPLLITFYRGGWCPFCNIALHSLQKHLPAFKKKNVTLVAISPELPDTSISTVQKHELEFEVLSDVGNEFADQLGIVWNMPSELRDVFAKFGNDLLKKNGDDTFAVPIPASILVNAMGLVTHTFVETDYTKRLDPEVALKWIDEL